MRITQAFPCKCRLGDIDKAPIVEEEVSIVHGMEMHKIIKVGGLVAFYFIFTSLVVQNQITGGET